MDMNHPPGEDKLHRLVFTASLMVGGTISSVFLFPSAFESWGGISRSRLALAGLLVGFGTSLGNGCTSGHGICGISSLRLRGLVATCTFLGVGMCTAVLADTASLLPAFENTLSYTPVITVCASGIGICGLLSAVAYMDRSSVKFARTWSLLIEAVSGVLFAAALSVSNMTKLSATISFLNITNFNPALMFVMGGGIGLSLPCFQYIFAAKSRKGSEFSNGPLLAGYKWSLPEATQIDVKLVLGAAIFGVGWGLVGACPGPALVNLGAAGSTPQLIYAFSMTCGMWLQQKVAGMW